MLVNECCNLMEGFALFYNILFLHYVLFCNQKAENETTVFSKVLQLVLTCANKVSWAAAEPSVSCPSV